MTYDIELKIFERPETFCTKSKLLTAPYYNNKPLTDKWYAYAITTIY